LRVTTGAVLRLIQQRFPSLSRRALMYINDLLRFTDAYH